MSSVIDLTKLFPETKVFPIERMSSANEYKKDLSSYGISSILTTSKCGKTITVKIKK